MSFVAYRPKSKTLKCTLSSMYAKPLTFKAARNDHAEWEIAGQFPSEDLFNSHSNFGKRFAKSHGRIALNLQTRVRCKVRCPSPPLHRFQGSESVYGTCQFTIR